MLDWRELKLDSEVVNPFVDPKKRAFELPVGCKDLNDVLLTLGTFQGKGLPKLAQGGLEEIRTCVRHLYEVFSRKILFITQFQKSVLLIARQDGGSFKLQFMLKGSDADLKDAAAQIFGEETFAKQSSANNVAPPLLTVLQEIGIESVRARLPENWEEAAQAIIDFLLCGYAICETDKLILFFQDRTVLPPGF